MKASVILAAILGMVVGCATTAGVDHYTKLRDDLSPMTREKHDQLTALAVEKAVKQAVQAMMTQYDEESRQDRIAKTAALKDKVEELSQEINTIRLSQLDTEERIKVLNQHFGLKVFVGD